MTLRYSHISNRKTEAAAERVGAALASSTGEPVPPAPVRHRDTEHGMVIHMKTTFDIDDSVMQRLRKESARRRTTMSALVEAGLRRILAEPATPDAPPDELPPLPSWNSGGALVDITNRDALYRAMEEE